MGLKLGDISPLAGVISGEGMYGKLADKGMLGLAPRMIASNAQEKDAAKERAAVEQAKEAEAMQKKKMVAKSRGPRPQQAGTEGGYKGYAKGGKVSSASKRADGCAIKGKTKGRMV